MGDAHGTISGDKFPKQQRSLSATANSSESARRHAKLGRTSLWSANQCKLTCLSQRRELDSRVLLWILTLLESQHQTSESRSPPVRGEPRARNWILLLCTSRFLVVFFSVDRGHGDTQAGHEDFGDTLAAHMDSGNRTRRGSHRFCCVTRYGSSVNGRIVVDVAASLVLVVGSILSAVVNVASLGSCATLRRRPSELPLAHATHWSVCHLGLRCAQQAFQS